MLMVLSFGMSVKAQNMAIATLQHDSDMKAFYGGDAFIEALDAAQTGDLISLSSGNFNAPDSITKAVIIQGAGMQLATLTEFPTIIMGDIVISLPDGESGLCIEGLSLKDDSKILIHSKITNLSLVKCRMFQVDFFDNQSNNCLIDRCYICEDIWPDMYCNGLVVRNSRFRNIARNDVSANLTVENCVFMQNNLEGVATGLFRNNVIFIMNGGVSMFYNNAYYSTSGDIKGSGNKNCNGYTGWGATNIENFFSSGAVPMGDANYNNQSTYQLTDEAAAKYLGTDGTQVGMYGGATPFTVVPSCPQVTKKEIASQSDSNGKLSIKITVETPNN